MLRASTTTAAAPRGLMRYPQKDFDANTDFVKFGFYDYVAPFSTGGGSLNATIQGNQATLDSYNTTVGNGSPKATVLLYMPEDIEGQYGANWQDQNLSNVARGVLGTFGAAAGANGIETMQSAFSTAYTPAENFLTKGTGVVNAISQALSMANFGSLTVNDIYGVSTGQILNPNTEVLYRGPKMRNFSLNFKMAPKNSSEAISIKNIIRAFKYATLPQFQGKGNKSASFVKVPQIVDVSFMSGGTENVWVNQFKPSVITNFDVSYTPDGAWATLTDGSPVATTIKISFQELKMLYADELTENGASY